MTAQISETLILDGNKLSMCTEPLADYFELSGQSPEFESPHTACWRGYVGTWEIIDDRLYLKKLKGWLRDGSEIGLGDLFPGYARRVFAHWFTDTIRVPQGELLEYRHMGYESLYERDLFLTFEKGVLTGRRVRANGVPDVDASARDYFSSMLHPERKG